MSFLFKGDVVPKNIPEGAAPRDIGGRGLFQALAQAAIQEAGKNNLGMGGLSPTGGRKRKSRMAGENSARIRVGSKKRGGAEAVNYSPRTREKDERERIMKEEAEGRVGSKVGKEEGRRRRRRRRFSDTTAFSINKGERVGSKVGKKLKKDFREVDFMPKRERKIK